MRTAEKSSLSDALEYDREVGDMLEQLRRSLETMQGNHGQMEGINEAVLHTHVALDVLLFKQAGVQQ
jgi:hypothetical protein